MSVPPNFLEQVRRKQREFLNALISESQLWTRPALTTEQVLAAGRKMGLEPILVSEFLVYWANAGEIDKYHFLRIADEIRRGS